jgi:high-affinity nickel-transport protein
MVRAYGWAFQAPLRKLWYHLTVTAASVLVALLICRIEALGLLGERLSLGGPFWGAVGRLNAQFCYRGLSVVGGFLLCWGVSTALWRWRGQDRLAGTE